MNLDNLFSGVAGAAFLAGIQSLIPMWRRHWKRHQLCLNVGPFFVPSKRGDQIGRPEFSLTNQTSMTIHDCSVFLTIVEPTERFIELVRYNTPLTAYPQTDSPEGLRIRETIVGNDPIIERRLRWSRRNDQSVINIYPRERATFGFIETIYDRTDSRGPQRFMTIYGEETETPLAQFKTDTEIKGELKFVCADFSAKSWQFSVKFDQPLIDIGEPYPVSWFDDW